MRKIVVLLMILSLVFVFSGCNGDAGATNEPPPPDPPPIEIEEEREEPTPPDWRDDDFVWEEPAGDISDEESEEKDPPEPYTGIDTNFAPGEMNRFPSIWTEEETWILANNGPDFDFSVTIWQGKFIEEPVVHPFLGGGEFMITMPEPHMYATHSSLDDIMAIGTPEWAVVPFVIEAYIHMEAIPTFGFNMSMANCTNIYHVLVNTDEEYRHDSILGLTAISGNARIPNDRHIAVAGYAIMNIHDMTSSPDGLQWTIGIGIDDRRINCRMTVEMWTDRPPYAMHIIPWERFNYMPE